MSKDVRIDGVKYVPALDASADVKFLMRALAAQHWGWDAKELDDPNTYKYLRIVVGDQFEEYDGWSLEELAAELVNNATEKRNVTD